eukprot:c11694_g1_i1 orf=195-4103(+)
MSTSSAFRNIQSTSRNTNDEREDSTTNSRAPLRRPFPFSDGATSISTSSVFKRSRMGTPALSCNTDAYSNALTVDSDDEVAESSMWVREEGRTSSELPSDFLEPLSPSVEVISPMLPFPARANTNQEQSTTHESRQFWKSGDFKASYDGATFATAGMDHARVHPKFLHSNATSHKWVLGAVAELLDNAVDEIRNGATYVKVDVMTNPRNGEPMLVIEDDGGGMDPECMRRCMSLGYSAKSKLSNTIGQYGNGFKTSTMRLGADVMVFSRSGGSKPSESIGMMSYTFLTATGQNDIVVPTVDFQIEAFGIRKLIRSTVDDWVESMKAIEKWSPYSSQTELVNQFKSMPRRQGTRVIIYNLWEDEEGLLELDFTTDPYDIQIRTTGRDDKSLKKLAARFASCRHYLTYRHSLRSYTSILYLRLPSRFRIFLRGKQVQHHSLRSEMMLVEEVTYRPKDVGHSKAVVTLGFVKDAKEHLDISGFNVYHKNRLIKPFWRIWNPSDTRGRGIIGILEANFVEPAHDKQGFERTIVLSRLEARLVEMQRSYWSKNCHRIGYTNTSLKKVAPPGPMDNNLAANGGNVETGHRDARHMSVVDRVDTNGLSVARHMSVVDRVDANGLSVANGGRDLSHIQAATRKEPETLRVSSAIRMLPVQGVSVSSARLEMQEQNPLLGSMDTIPSGAVKSNSVFSQRQDAPHVGQNSVLSDITSHHVQDVSLNPARLDSATLQPSGSLDVTLSHLQSTSFSAAKLDFQTLCPPPFSTGMASVVIDLDSPDVDQECEGAASGMYLPKNCDAPKQITEDCCLSRGASACENVLPSRERSGHHAGSPECNEAGRLIGASISFPAVTVLGEAEAPPERLSVQSCGHFSEAVSTLDKVIVVNDMEARSERIGLESHCQSAEVVITANEVSTTLNIKDLPRIQRKCGAFELETESFSQGKPMQENAASKVTTMINVADVEASNLLRPSTTSDEAHVSAMFELDDLFDNLLPQNDVPQHTPQFIKAGDASVASPGIDMDLILPEISGNAMCENDSMLLLDSPEALGGNGIAIGTERGDVDGEEHENTMNVCQLPCKDVVKNAGKGQRLQESDTQQVARVLRETEAAMSNLEGQEGDCLLPKQGLEKQAPVVGQLSATPVALALRTSCLEQEGTGNLRLGAIKAMNTPNFTEASRDGIQNDTVLLPQEGTSFDSQSANLDTLGNFQASNQAMQQDLIGVPALTAVASATGVIPSSSCGDSFAEDLTTRLLFAKQQIESLQQGIEAVVAEADDMREQLQRQSQLQELDMRNLNMELERALSRLEELKG